MAYEIGWITGRHWHERGMVETLSLSDVVAKPVTFAIDNATYGTSADGGTTAVVTHSTAGTNRLIVVLCPHSGNGSSAVISSVSGSTLGAFTRIIQLNTGTSGNAEIWARIASSQLSSESITVTYATGWRDTRASVISFAGPKDTSTLANNFGATGTVAGTPSSASQVPITVSAVGSYLVAAMIDTNGTQTLTMRTTSVASSQIDDGGGVADYSNFSSLQHMYHRSTAVTDSTGAVYVGASAPTNATIWGVAVEILAA